MSTPQKFHIQAVLFDLIGTTVLEEKPNIIQHCFSQVFDEHTIEVPTDFLERSRGLNKLDVMADALRMNQRNPQQAQELMHIFEQVFIANLKYFKAAPGIERLISWLNKKNILMGLASGLPRDLFAKIQDQMPWQKTDFAYQATYEEIGQGRPSPALVHDMMQKLEINQAHHILKIGDTIADIQEGKNANTLTAVVLSGTQPAHLLLMEKPDIIIHQLNDLEQYIA